MLDLTPSEKVTLEAEKRGKREGKLETAKKLKERAIPVKKIAAATGFSLETIKSR
ncbi:MAG: hypothetical protein LBT14_04525 [Treponema sp.]|nr:hypothetical protein [Treponema sp.]